MFLKPIPLELKTFQGQVNFVFTNRSSIKFSAKSSKIEMVTAIANRGTDVCILMQNFDPLILKPFVVLLPGFDLLNHLPFENWDFLLMCFNYY